MHRQVLDKWMLAVTACIMLLCVLPAAAEEQDEVQSNQPTLPKKIEYDKLALPELRRLAERRDLQAQFELGSRANYGRGMPRNTREALRWLRRAAQNGQPDAQRLLAVKLYNGYDVASDHDEAFRWAQRLAETGDRPAQLMLASMYANGEGIGRSLVRAYMWYDIASAARPGEEPGDEAIAAMRSAGEQRDQTGKLLLPEQEAEAQQLASDWWSAKGRFAKSGGASAAPRAAGEQ